MSLPEPPAERVASTAGRRPGTPAPPRRPVPAEAASPPPLEALEDWLASREAAVPGLRPGTARHIDWYDGLREQRPLSVVYLHGFSATRRETHPLARQVGQALGAHVFHARLAGHGRDGQALAAATAEAWIADGVEALAIGRRLGGQTVVIACSTGATVAAAVLMAHPAEAAGLRALAMLSPNFGIANRAASILHLPFGLHIGRLIAGAEQGFEPRSEAQARYWTVRYPIEAVATMMSLLRRVRRGDPARVSMPVLTLYAPGDQVLNVPAIHRMHRRFPNPQNRIVAVTGAADPSQHVLAGDILSPNTTDSLTSEIVSFVRRLGEPGPAAAAP